MEFNTYFSKLHREEEKEKNEILTKATDFITKVVKLINPSIMNPAKIHLISEIPDPAA